MKFQTFVENYVPAFITYPIAAFVMGIWLTLFGTGIVLIRVLLPVNRQENAEDWLVEHFSPYE